jgi:hypothetical protein
MHLRNLSVFVLAFALAGCAAKSPHVPPRAHNRTQRGAYQTCVRTRLSCEDDCGSWWHYALIFARSACLSSCAEAQDACIADAE